MLLVRAFGGGCSGTHNRGPGVSRAGGTIQDAVEASEERMNAVLA